MRKRWGRTLWLVFVGTAAVIGAVVFGLLRSDTEVQAKAEEDYGALLPAQAQAGATDPNCRAASAADRAGMSGAEGKADLHGSDPKTMWCVTPAEGQKAEIAFDLGRVEPLGELWIWNYAAVPEFGMKDVRVFTSVDGEAWEEWKGTGYPFRLAMAAGSGLLQATNLDGEGAGPIRFEGLPARYVKLVADERPGQGNWSAAGERTFGLSEARLYRYQRKVVYDGPIDPLSASDGASGDSRPENVINRYGMSGISENKALHGNDADTMWLASGVQDAVPSLTVDLGGTYPLKEMRVWNYNAAGKTDHGMRDVSIAYSIDGRAWTELRGDEFPYRLARADGSAGLAATNLDNSDGSKKTGAAVAFGGAQARYVKLTPIGGAGIGNWGAEDAQGVPVYGLSELRFYADAGLVAEPARDWNGLFSRFESWTGADGIFSVPLDGYDQPGKLSEGSRTLFEFSDTFVGRVNGISGMRETASMVNNSIGFLDGAEPDPAKIRFDVAPKSIDLSLFTPHTPHSETLPGSWYWLQDAYVKDGWLYTFPLLMAKDLSQDPGFQFAIEGVAMITVPITEDGLAYADQVQVDAPLYARLPDGRELVFGAGITDNTTESGAPDPDGYLYIYGYENNSNEGTKGLLVARVVPDRLQSFADWRFWDGSDWSSRIEEADPVLDGVSPELSVTPMTEGRWQGKYLAISELDTLSGYVAYAAGDTPYGPFEPFTRLYYTVELEEGQGITTYNAKAHPHLSREGELLVTYNVNTTDAMANTVNASIYRPRWLRLREIAPV